MATSLTIRCDRDRDESDIRGTWYRITNDSTYGEFIATEFELYTYDEDAGDLFVKYRIEDDSLRLFWNEQNTLTYKFERIGKDRFNLTHPRFRSICYRMGADIDTMKILSTKRSLNRTLDENYFSDYMRNFRHRKLKWEQKNGSR